MMEYVPGGLMFDVIKSLVSCGEDGGRFFLRQMLDVLEHLQSNKVSHRDLKLENILVDDQLNLKVADFGFATYTDQGKLNSYRGTQTYMAPEIKKQEQYSGNQVDIFSTGVLIYISVLGIFPFIHASTNDDYYKLLATGQFDAYWKKIGA